MTELERLYDLLPWLCAAMFGGGLVLGFVVGRLIKRRTPRRNY